VNLTAQQFGIELESNQEHVKDDAQLRHDAEERDDRRRQNEEIGLGSDCPEQRGPEQDAANDLAEDRRLTNGGEQPAKQPADDDDRGQRDQQV
jgi:hypothetical protein